MDVSGTFAQQEAVSLVVVERRDDGGYDAKGKEVGRALVNYTSLEVSRIKGLQSSRIQELLGYAGRFEKFVTSRETGSANDCVRFRVYRV